MPSFRAREFVAAGLALGPPASSPRSPRASGAPSRRLSARRDRVWDTRPELPRSPAGRFPLPRGAGAKARSMAPSSLRAAPLTHLQNLPIFFLLLLTVFFFCGGEGVIWSKSG